MTTSTKFHSSDAIQDSIESLQLLHHDNRSIIYWIFLFTTAAAVASLWLIRVDVSVGAAGQIRPKIERLAVAPAISGKILQLKVSDNERVLRGDVLLVIDSPAADARLAQNQSQSAENQRALDDLAVLLAGTTSVANSEENGSADFIGRLSGPDFNRSLPSQLHTQSGIRQHSVLVSDIQHLLLQYGKADHDLERSDAIHKKGLISDADFEQQRYALHSIEGELRITLQQAMSKWQAEKIDRELRKIDWESEAKQLQEEKNLRVIRAPIDGVAMGFTGLQPGLYVSADKALGEISPDSGLQAEAYVGMRDIGFVSVGQPANLQVDAFPFTEWGMVRGHVRQISQDFVQLGQQVVFKAVIDLDGTQLKSSKGVVVELRRGMTVNARLVVKKQTLYNLLYTSLSQSLDPQAKPNGG